LKGLRAQVEEAEMVALPLELATAVPWSFYLKKNNVHVC
jgi:hypothetical protein